MKKFLVWIIALVMLVLMPALVYAAAGSCRTTTVHDPLTGAVIGYKMVWLSDASGDVNGRGAVNMAGHLTGVRFVPDAGGTAPSALYDVTLLDDAGLDILHGAGANLPQSATDTSNYQTPLTVDGAYIPLFGGQYTPVVTNAGAAKGGTIYLKVD